MGQITYLCGPPGCGKSTSLRSRYVQAVREHGCDSVIWLAPDLAAAEMVRDQVVHELGGLYDPRLFTFPALAQALLNANHARVAELAPCQRALLVEHVATSPQVGLATRLTRFPGFLNALAGLLDELKRAAVAPEALQEALKRIAPDDANAQALGRFYEQYQRLLEQQRVFDEPGLFWWARSLLAEGRRQPFEQAQLVLVDGFTDFTTTQLQVLNHLAAHVNETVVTLPLQDDEVRQELFAPPQRTLQRLQAEVGRGRMERLAGCPGRPQPLSHLLDNLFLLEPAQSEPQECVTLIAAPGILAEVRDVLRQVKDLLLAGVRPEQVALVYRSLKEYRQPLQEIAREMGVPLAVGGQEPISARPPVQAVLDILQVPLADYRQADVVKLLKSNFIDLAILQDSESSTAAEDLEWLACEARVISGLNSWQTQLALYSRRLHRERDLAAQGLTMEESEDVRDLAEIDHDLALVEQGTSLFSRLVAQLEPLRGVQTRAEHVRNLLGLIGRFGVAERLLHPAACQDMATNVAAFDSLIESLSALADAEALLETSQRIDLRQFAAEVRTLAAETNYALPLRSEGRVVVLDAHSARQLRRPHLFIGGLVEAHWPLVRSEKPFFDDRERIRLNREGIALDLASDLQREEAYLFYLACAAAESRLYLSYPTIDSMGQPLLRSHYVDEVAATFTSGSLELHQRRLSDVLVSPSQLAGVRELLERAAHDENEMLLQCCPAATRPLAAHVFTCAKVERQRYSRQYFESHDGVFSDPQLLLQLERRFGLSYTWSATGLGKYGNCPMAFLLQRVLKLRTLEPPTEEVENLDIGRIIHKILQAFFSWRFAQKPLLPLGAEEASEATEMMKHLVAEEFQRWETEGLVTHRVLWRLACEQVQRDLASLIAFEINSVASFGLAPRAFEVKYAMTLPPSDGEVLKVSGKIDRVDAAAEASTAGRDYAVYDYKGGAGVSPDLIKEGVDFQMPFYVLGAQHAVFGNESPPAQCLHWAYYRYRRPVGFKSRVEKDPIGPFESIEAYLQAAVTNAYTHVRDVRRGRFPVLPHNCGYCEFDSICRYLTYRCADKVEEAHS